MSMDQDRRAFLKRIASAGQDAIMSATPVQVASAVLQQRKASKPMVVVERRNDVQANGTVRADVVKAMLFDAVRRITGQKADKNAWMALFKPTDVVGIKVNCIAGIGMSTRPEVAMAIADGLRLAGVKPENIIIWERSDGELVRAGYRLNRDGAGVRCYGTNGDYQAEPTRYGTFHGRYSKILAEQCTALVNAPVIKDHGITGVTLAFKNHYGSIDNPGAYHRNYAPGMVDMNACPVVKNKTKLVVCDALRGVCNGGPGYNREFAFETNALLVSTDPVAVDAVGWKMIEEQRKLKGLPTLQQAGRPVLHLEPATEAGLGECDLTKIQVVEAGKA